MFCDCTAQIPTHIIVLLTFIPSQFPRKLNKKKNKMSKLKEMRLETGN